MEGVHYENRWKWLLQIRSAHDSGKFLTSRIVKSAHWIVCQIYDPQVTARTLNAKMRYKMSTNYQMAKEKQRHVREIRKTRDAATDKGSMKKKHKASANVHKATQ